MQNVWKFWMSNNPVAWVECTLKSKYLDLILVPGGNNKPLPAAVHRRGKSTNITSHYKHYHPSYQTLVGLYNHSVGLRISHQQQARRLMVSELASGTTIRRALAQVTSEYECSHKQLLQALELAQESLNISKLSWECPSSNTSTTSTITRRALGQVTRTSTSKLSLEWSM